MENLLRSVYDAVKRDYFYFIHEFAHKILRWVLIFLIIFLSVFYGVNNLMNIFICPRYLLSEKENILDCGNFLSAHNRKINSILNVEQQMDAPCFYFCC